MNAPPRIDLVHAVGLAALAAVVGFWAGLYVGTRRLAGEALSPDAEGGRRAAAPRSPCSPKRAGRPARFSERVSSPSPRPEQPGPPRAGRSSEANPARASCDRPAPRAPAPGRPLVRVAAGGAGLRVRLRPVEPPAGRPAWLVRLLAAIRAVESSGGRDRRDGRAGEVGPYQISPPHWLDACRHGGVDWHHWWAADRRMSERVVLWYWARWAPAALAAGDRETLARVHNGGPDGAHKPQTDVYWARVRALLTAAERRAE